MNTEEIWQVEVNGQIYESNLAELGQWIEEGALLPQDKVRRGNLRWLEAGKVPFLHSFFNTKELNLPVTVVQPTINTVGNDEKPETLTENFATAQNVIQSKMPEQFRQQKPEIVHETFQSGVQTLASPPQIINGAPPNCSIHANEPAKFVCETCGSAFCPQCPKSFGGSVKICPMCGAMCNPINELKAGQEKNLRQHRATKEGFGFEDFGKSLAYPFRFKTSLIFGAVMFMFFTLGQSASAMGGMFMLAAAISCAMMANALTFGILANTVENFSQGVTESNFMPSFDDFSLWDDVVHPFFLSIGAYIVSFGLLIVISLGAVWYTWSAISGANNLAQQKSVAAVMPDAQDDLNSAKQIPQIEQIQKQLNQNHQWKNGQMPDENQIAQAQNKSANNEEARFQRLEETINQSRKAQMEAVVGKSPEEERASFGQMTSAFLQTAKVFLIPMFLALLWALFYFPAACAVAGYTRSFTATLNPFVGLDTIKHLGADYAKILGMCLILGIFSAIVNAVLSFVFSPLDLPKMGNLPAKAIGSFVTFYFSIVFSVILGYALYKNSEKLNLYRG